MGGIEGTIKGLEKKGRDRQKHTLPDIEIR